MAEPGALDYFYGTEAEQYTFYRIPKVLFTDPGFRRITADAKILYGLMLDRMGLSIRNGWLDEQERVFIYFTLEEAMAGADVFLRWKKRWTRCAVAITRRCPCSQNWTRWA